MKLIAIALSLCLLAGCATTGLQMSSNAKKESIAQGVLQRDVVGMLHIVSHASNPDCQMKTVTSVQLKEEPKEGNDGVIRAKEIWTVDLCGVPTRFEIEFYETPGQGTTFGIKML